MINIEEVKHIAKLARITFEGRELKELQKELSSILNYIDKLKEINIENVELANFLDYSPENVMREDKVVKQSPGTVNRLLEAAPQRKGRLIKVKSVF